jgi:putative oxidoreductase
VGGALLILGVQARWIAIALTPAMFVAIIWEHGANGWAFTAPNGGWEYSAFLLIASVVQFLLGDRVYALAPSTTNPRAVCRRLIVTATGELHETPTLQDR